VNTPSYQATYPTLAFKPDAQRTYYLNGIWKSDDISKLDYSATFDVKGGSMVTIESDGGNNGGIYTAYQKARRYECPMPPGIEMQPYLGQFLHVKVESVTPMN
jgi:hypothetical protein